MIIIDNFLKPEELKFVKTQFELAKQTKLWKSSRQDWDKKLIKGHSNWCLMTFLDFKTRQLIESKILEHLPQLENFSISAQYYRWPKGSAINAHNDGSKLFGATLYLNDVWLDEWGGIFVYKDTEQQKCRIKPKLNCLVFNDNHESHWITPVDCYQERTTIQIWGYRPIGKY